MADVNYKSFGNEKNLTVQDETLPPQGINPKDYSDILKFSKCETTKALRCTITAGKENCSDAVQGSGYLWSQCIFIATSPCYGALTIKGAIDGWILQECDFSGHGDKFDVEVGQYDDYWYPGRKPTRNGVIAGCQPRDEKPIVVQLWDAEKPVVTDSNVKIVKIPWIIWFPYFMFKYLKHKFL
jgi:hypothetical protein